MNHAVFYMEVSRVKRGYYEVEFKLVTREPDKMPEYAVTDRYFQLLEDTIRKRPELWLWSHNRWKRTREKFSIAIHLFLLLRVSACFASFVPCTAV